MSKEGKIANDFLNKKLKVLVSQVVHAIVQYLKQNSCLIFGKRRLIKFFELDLKDSIS